MSAVTTLFTQYSAVDVVLLLIITFTAIKAVNELVSYFWEKAKNYFRQEQEDENQQIALVSKLDDIGQKIDGLGLQISTLEERVSKSESSITSLKDKVNALHESVNGLSEQSKKTDDTLIIVQERLQNQARDKLIELHHKYVYEYKMIDDIGLESMERTYLYYKAAGGDTFIDTLMDEVRELPRPALEDRKILEAIQ